MDNNPVKNIKKSQKESVLYRYVSQFFVQISQDSPELWGLTINRVELSPDKSVCSVFLYTPDGIEAFRAKLPQLLLYKPSLRTAIAHALQSRYVPQIIFKYDTRFEKQLALEQLLDKIKAESQS
jgi:ribosome-binding factor A